MIGGKVQTEVAQVVPITLTFSHVSYTIKVRPSKNPFRRKVDKMLLKDVSGEFRPGEVTAIIGPSGAGKTTLLNLLAGRMPGGKMTGQVFINGKKKKEISKHKWARLSAYIMQDDVLHGNLTPKEVFWFSAQLRLPFSLDLKSRSNKVAALLEELGLEGCAKQRIGTVEKRGISGGQRKRVSIGTELITDPSVLFLDEPTSGLDSSTSYALVDTLKKLASCGRTIITTVHSPSTDIFFKFDKLILMSEGHILFNGRTTDVVPYFSKLNYKCPKYTNPAEYIMDLAKKDSHISTHEEGEARVRELIDAYRESKNLSKLDPDKSGFELVEREDETRRGSFIGTHILRRRNTHSQEQEFDIEAAAKKEEEHQKALEEVQIIKGPPQIVRFFLLIIRACLIMIRDPMMTYARLMQTLFLALVVGFLYLRVGDDQRSIQDREGALFFIVVNQAMGGLMNVLVMFPTERLVFIREHSTGAFSTVTYYLAKTVADFPFMVVFPMIFSVITYWMVGLRADADRFFIYMACLIVVTLAAQSLGLAISAGVSDIGIAMALAPAVFIPLMLFGGYFLNDSSIPDWLMWLKYFSLFKYGFQILAINELDGETFYCTSSQLNADGSCPYTTGSQVLASLNFNNNESSIWASFLFLFMHIILFRFIGYLTLTLTAGRKRG